MEPPIPNLAITRYSRRRNPGSPRPDPRYRYADPEPEQPPAPEEFDLAALDPELRRRLHEAALSLGVDRTLAVVEEIRPHDEPLARGLAALVEGFRFDRVIGLCEGEEGDELAARGRAA
jgi:hypothetical protein